MISIAKRRRNPGYAQLPELKVDGKAMQHCRQGHARVVLTVVASDSKVNPRPSGLVLRMLPTRIVTAVSLTESLLSFARLELREEARPPATS